MRISRTLIGWALLLTCFTAGVCIAPQKADAFLGIGDTTLSWEMNPAVTGAVVENAAGTTAGWISQAGEWIYEKAFKIVLERLKKRLLDTVTDQIIAWIQYGTEPQFISNFGDVFTNAADAAVGDMLVETGLGDFCSSQTGPLLNLALRQARSGFSRAPSCTLSQVVRNVEAFGDDFSQGGWLGLQTLANPENNRYGQFIVLSERLERLTEKKQVAAQLEAQANNGFTPTKQCVEWRRSVLKADDTDIEEVLMPGKDTPVIPWVNAFYDPTNIPPSQIDPASASAVGYRPGIYPWTCSKTDITTPGTVAQEGANRAIYSDIDYLIGSNELSTYLGAIADAALNRLTTETYKGLKGMMRSQTTNPTPAGAPPYTTPAAVTAAGTSYTGVRNTGATQNRQSILSGVETALRNAQSDLPTLAPIRSQIEGLIEGVGSGYGYGLPELALCLSMCPAIPELVTDITWVQTASSTARAASSTLAALEDGPTSISRTINAPATGLLALQSWLLIHTNPTAEELSSLNTQTLTTANGNHSAFEAIKGFINATTPVIPTRLLYCNGDISRTPPVNACSPYSGL
jgi:hypothetical protein